MSPEDEREFREFVTARSGSLLRVAYPLTGEVHLAQDLPQTALLGTMRRWGAIRRREHPEGVLRTAMYRPQVNRWRLRAGLRVSTYTEVARTNPTNVTKLTNHTVHSGPWPVPATGRPPRWPAAPPRASRAASATGAGGVADQCGGGSGEHRHRQADKGDPGGVGVQQGGHGRVVQLWAAVAVGRMGSYCTSSLCST